MHAIHSIVVKRPKFFVILGGVCGGAWALATAWTAVAEAFAPEDLPDLLAIILARLPIVFPIHMVTGGLTLVLVPLAIMVRRWPRWHRICGLLAGLCILTSGVTALRVAVYSISPLPARIGFFVQGIIWITLFLVGFSMIRQHRVAIHRRLMLMMAAVTSGAMLFRLALAGFTYWQPGVDYKPFYSAIAWLGWMLPLVAVIWLTRSPGQPIAPMKKEPFHTNRPSQRNQHTLDF